MDWDATWTPLIMDHNDEKNYRLDAVGQHGPFRRNSAGLPHDAGYVDGGIASRATGQYSWRQPAD